MWSRIPQKSKCENMTGKEWEKENQLNVSFLYLTTELRSPTPFLERRGLCKINQFYVDVWQDTLVKQM